MTAWLACRDCGKVAIEVSDQGVDVLDGMVICDLCAVRYRLREAVTKLLEMRISVGSEMNDHAIGERYALTEAIGIVQELYDWLPPLRDKEAP
jgi:uncharacterized protein YbaR (Trm112 family)